MSIFSPVPDDRIRFIQLETLYKNSSVVFFANVINTSLFILVLWDEVETAWLLIWGMVMMLWTSIRSIIAWYYWRDEVRDQSIDKWLRLFAGPALVSGLIWGIAGYSFYLPEGGVYQAFLVIFLLGIAAGSMAFLSSHLPTFYGFFMLLMFPLIIRMFQEASLPHLVMGSMMIVYLLVFMVFGRNVNQVFLESILLRFDNLELVSRLTKEKEVAEKANIAKSKFLAAASHDLRQPLHALSLLVGALAERIQYKEVRGIVDKIRAAVTALENLFNALLDISKLDSGILQPCIEDFQLQPLFDSMENDYRPEAELKGLTFDVDNCGELVVRSDTILLERVLRNIVSNAVRYTNKGSINLTARQQGGQIAIMVTDTGLGIPQEKQGVIFNEYVQLDNPERDREKGLGLGLAIVSRIVHLLGHELQLESTEGGGSEFRVYVPLGENAKQIQSSVDMAPEFNQELRGMQVLVIDDEKAILDALKVLLAGWGCDVITAETVEEARQELISRDVVPNAILSDYRLRENITGIEAIKAIEAMHGQEIPALLITGDMNIEPSTEKGMNEYRILHKPVQPARLRAFLKHVQGQTPLAADQA
ncbi:MAG: ATP-binding protein [Gammaproteobacteria bacterium]|nr:ATP-binding protein [Gammaproteobacteria bacterium]